jgi:hypothetical protein
MAAMSLTRKPFLPTPNACSCVTVCISLVLFSFVAELLENVQQSEKHIRASIGLIANIHDSLV